MTLWVESGPVQRKSRCPLRAKSGRPRCKKAYPLYPQYRTVRCEGKCPLGAISEQNLGRISVAFHSLGWSRGRRSNVGPSETSTAVSAQIRCVGAKCPHRIDRRPSGTRSGRSCPRQNRHPRGYAPSINACAWAEPLLANPTTGKSCWSRDFCLHKHSLRHYPEEKGR